MKVSKRAQQIPASATIAVTAKAKQLKADGVDVVSFGAGEPDFDTPDFIKQAAIKSMEAGRTKYTAAAGTPEIKAAIAEKLKKENGLDYSPQQVVVNIGAKHSIYEIMQAVIDPGDEVILQTPYWVTYPETIKMAGGRPIFIETTAENGYEITPESLKNAITDKTAMLLINSPNNPGGFMYSPRQLTEIAKTIEGTDIIVVSDEIYEKLVYGDITFASFASLSDDAYKRTLTVNGLSKTFSMTGWRIGYTAGPVEIIKAMGRMQSHMTSNAVTFVQDAAIAAMKSDGKVVEQMRVEFEKRGLYMAQRLNKIKGVKCSVPQGAFYCFPDVSGHFGRKINGAEITGSMDFARLLLEQENVAVVPGFAFGCDNNIRLSFACSLEQIEKGLDRIEKWLS